VAFATAAPQRWALLNIEGTQIGASTANLGAGPLCYVGEGVWGLFSVPPILPAVPPTIQLIRWDGTVPIATKTVYTAGSVFDEVLGIEYDNQYFVIFYRSAQQDPAVFKIAWVDPDTGLRVHISADLSFGLGGPIALPRMFHPEAENRANASSVIYIIDRASIGGLARDKIEIWSYPELNRRNTSNISRNTAGLTYGLSHMGQFLSISVRTFGTDFVDVQSRRQRVHNVPTAGTFKGVAFDGRNFLVSMG